MLAGDVHLFQKKEEPMSTDADFFLALGPGTFGFDSGFINDDGTPVFESGVHGLGSKAGVQAQAGAAEGPRNNNVFSGVAGVWGTSRDSPGAAGTSVNNIGVYGQTEQLGAVPNLVAGVFGTGNFRPGVVGSSSQGIGVQGASFLTTGVRGTSFRGPGVQGQAAVGSGVIGVSGTFGPAPQIVPNVAGVVGTADQHPGVIGTSNALIGVYGFSASNGGVVGQSGNPNSFGGFFFGNVHITGTLTADGGKAAVVPFPDGSKRVLYSMESPELWFEDFGTAKLKNGRAVVKLDANFASVIKRGYLVFLTPEGDCRGLSVRRKRAANFEVRELAGGKSSVAFSYRIVGRRKDIRRQARFAKVNTHLSLPAAATRPPRKGAPTAATLRAFVAGLEKKAGERRPKGARKGRRLRA
jgi:hypothetical protein